MAGASLGIPITCLDREVWGNALASLVSFLNLFCRETRVIYIHPAGSGSALYLVVSFLHLLPWKKKLLSPLP